VTNKNRKKRPHPLPPC